MKKTLIILSLTCCIPVTAFFAQLSPGAVEQFINREPGIRSVPLQYPGETKEFYKEQFYAPVWTVDRALMADLLYLFKEAGSLGLDENDYQHGFITQLHAGNFFPATARDSVLAELRLTDAAIHFVRDILYGNTAPPLRYNGLNYAPACVNILSVLKMAIAKRQISYLPDILEPATGEYAPLRAKIIRYRRVIADTAFKEVKITSAKVSHTNRPLLVKLFQLGFMDSLNQPLADSTVRRKVKEAQRMLNLLADGVLRSTSLAAFNVPLVTRLSELNYALNIMRWLSCIKKSQSVIVVNIPSATLLLYQNNKVALESRIIAGKRSTPTPMIGSKINEVILYPYWMVPYSIATKELLPSIKRNIGYLDANGYQVINRQGRIVDPYTIDWSALSTSYFPYIIRQSTGCDNALGLIKLNFYNPFSAYLHDTPAKSLFTLNKRFFSHGCMRVEKAIELGRFVLKNNTIAIDTLTEKGCLYHQSPVVIPADERVAVFVLYSTAWIDSAGKLSFSEDIYRKHPSLLRRY